MKKTLLIGFVTAIAAVAGAIISIIAFLKRGEKSRVIDDLDYEGEEFFEEDFDDMETMDLDIEEYGDKPQEVPEEEK